MNSFFGHDTCSLDDDHNNQEGQNDSENKDGVIYDLNAAGHCQKPEDQAFILHLKCIISIFGIGSNMSKKGKRKLTPAEKREKARRRAEYKTVFMNGKQKLIKREPTIDGMSVDEFIRRNADPIWLHQNEMWEYLHEHEGEGNMNINPDLVAPCGLYCGVCAVYIAHRDQNQKFKERLLSLYKGEIPGKGKLPNSENLTIDDICCNGCLSDDIFMHCRQCAIRDCTQEQGYAGCHQCDDFPCSYIDDFPMTIGKKVILRAIPYWREVGTEKWIQDEENRYICSECGNILFRGVVTCNRCKTELELD